VIKTFNRLAAILINVKSQQSECFVVIAWEILDKIDIIK
jgi:hypothetical protein